MLLNLKNRRKSTGNNDQDKLSLTLPERINRLNMRLSSQNYLLKEHRTSSNVRTSSQQAWSTTSTPNKVFKGVKLYKSPHTPLEVISK